MGAAHTSSTKGRRRSRNPGRPLRGRGLRNLIRLRGGRVLRESAHHVLMECDGVLVTVPVLKGHIPNSTLRAVAETLRMGGRLWHHLHT